MEKNYLHTINFKITRGASSGPKRNSEREPMKIQATETKSLLDKLVHDIIQIVADKNHQYRQLQPLINSYQDCCWVVDLLVYHDGVVRRLAACLLSLVFEQKEDAFGTQLLKAGALVCAVKDRLFLTKISPAIRNSRPEPLYHVKKALMYYLPASTFPSGLPCYLDDSKLKSMLLSKEYLRLPDPKDQIIWMTMSEEFELLSNFHTEESPVNSGQSQLRTDPFDLEHNSAEVPSPRLAFFESRTVRLDQCENPRNSVSPPLLSPTRRSQIEIKEINPELVASGSIKPESGVHRIKCFQFFRKQKDCGKQFESNSLASSQLQECESGTPWAGQAQRSIMVEIASPQFESVNDWATDKDNTVIKTQQKYIDVTATNQKQFTITRFPGTSVIPSPGVTHVPFVGDFNSVRMMMKLDLMANSAPDKTKESEACQRRDFRVRSESNGHYTASKKVISIKNWDIPSSLQPTTLGKLPVFAAKPKDQPVDSNGSSHFDVKSASPPRRESQSQQARFSVDSAAKKPMFSKVPVSRRGDSDSSKRLSVTKRWHKLTDTESRPAGFRKSIDVSRSGTISPG